MQIYVLTLSILNDVQVEFISRTLSEPAGCRRTVIFPFISGGEMKLLSYHRAVPVLFSDMGHAGKALSWRWGKRR